MMFKSQNVGLKCVRSCFEVCVSDSDKNRVDRLAPRPTAYVHVVSL